MSYSIDGSDATSRKRLRRTKESADGMENAEHFVPASASVDEKLFDVYFPKHLESNFAAAIFELGLKHSSPKILMVRSCFPCFPVYSIFNSICVFVYAATHAK